MGSVPTVRPIPPVATPHNKGASPPEEGVGGGAVSEAERWDSKVRGGGGGGFGVQVGRERGG